MKHTYMLSLSTPVIKIPGIGPALQAKLKRLGIQTARDLLFHFPHRYEDFSNLIPIAQVTLNSICTIQGKILQVETTRTWKRRLFITEALVQDQSGAIKIVWFGQPYLTKILKRGDVVFLSGKAAVDKKGVYITSPVYEKIGSADSSALQNAESLTHTGRLVAVYPETVGLSSRWFRSAIKFLLKEFEDKISETLPPQILKENGFLPINVALRQTHFPDSKTLAEQAQRRFSFEELFYIELFVLRERSRLNQEKAISIPLDLELIQRFVKSLPFTLTAAQKKSAWQILKDLEKPRPMNRLLEGDVGSGKTVVATMAALNAMKAGYQVAFMAPTEILAKQHFQEVQKLLRPFKLDVGLLTGKEDKFFSKKLLNDPIEISRRKLLEKAEKGDIDILIGTHALIQDQVRFGNLALVILDEQHRFGVEQRAGLSKKSAKYGGKKIPHLLSMTATPIPRTLALTLYGDLDLSLLNEMPKGRKKIITRLVHPDDRPRAYEFIKQEIQKGRQVFVICPRIEKPETLNPKTKRDNNFGWAEVKAVKEEYEILSKEIFPDLKVGMLHGKIAGKEKERIMRDFKNKKIDILVSTSVIEVGIDVPNASVMMIEGADRFGLAQLHQFRGRVGRGEFQSYCLLLTDSRSRTTSSRLHALVKNQDGFALAEKDLEIRGPGEFGGTKQWGIPDLMMNSLKDISLVEKTRQIAKEILQENPHLNKYPLLQARINQFRQRIHLE